MRIRSMRLRVVRLLAALCILSGAIVTAGPAASATEQAQLAGRTGATLDLSGRPILATNATVAYRVHGRVSVVRDGDGSCGSLRRGGSCDEEPPGDDPSDPPGEDPPSDDPGPLVPGLIVMTVNCPDCADESVDGATVDVSGVTDAGDAYEQSADTNANGTVTFSVPPGVYDVAIVDVPPGHAIDPDTAVDADIDVDAGETVNLTNTITRSGSAKVIDLAPDPEIDYLVCVFERGVGQGGKPLPVGDVEDCAPLPVEQPKGYEPGQGEDEQRLRNPDFSYLYAIFAERTGEDIQVGDIKTLTSGFFSDVLECEDFVYSDDVDEFLDEAAPFYFPATRPIDEGGLGYDPLEGCEDELDPIPYVRDETPEEVGERLGTVVTPEYTDDDGDAIFELPAGCYYAVISGEGYETAVEEFCLEPGEIEINEVDVERGPVSPPTST